MKQENIKSSGKVVQELGNSMFRVELDTGAEVLCTISGKIRKNFIRIISGDKVILEMSPYDLTRGRIVERVNPNKNKVVVNNSNNNSKKKKKK